MAKRRKKQTDDAALPPQLPGVVPQSEPVVETKTPEPEPPVIAAVPEPSPSVTTSTLDVPRMTGELGYARQRVDCSLTGSQAAVLKSIQLGLEAKDAKLANGRHVSTPTHAVQWIIEQA